MFSASKTAGPSGYNIANSLRFRSSASAYLSRTPASAGNRTTWTLSYWTKMSNFGTNRVVLDVSGINTNYGLIFYNTGNTLDFQEAGGGSARLTTNRVYRDPSAWYHIVCVWDTTNPNASDRMRIYTNGVRETSFSNNITPSLNAQSTINTAALTRIGWDTDSNSGWTLDGYLADINFIDGQALTPSSFGEIDSTTGVWKAKRYTGTYGTNGFRLNFSNGTSTTTLGYDSSGNGNNWTTNNISLTAGSTYDWMLDSPTPFAGTSYGVGNYCVLNQLSATNATISNAGLTGSLTGAGGYASSFDGLTSGKWYWELTYDAAVSNFAQWVGALSSAYPNNNNAWNYGSQFPLYASDGRSGVTGAAYGASWSTGDVIGVALDLSSATGTCSFYKNGVSQGVLANALVSSAGWRAVATGGTSGIQSTLNFGQRPFAYTPPSGYKTLCTQNLPGVTIQNGAQYMAATLYTGTGSTQSISNAVNSVSFQPDFVWGKCRSAGSTSNWFENSVTGAGLILYSDQTIAEQNATTYLPSFNANGFSVAGNTSYFNASGSTYVAWQWKAGGTAVTNTAGSITSSVSANTTAGFSVVTYTGNGVTSATVGHGLGVTPAMLIVKDRTTTHDWFVWQQKLSSGYQLRLNLTIAQEQVSSATNLGGLGTPTSTTFGFIAGLANTDNVNQSGNTYVAYCFAAIPGYSAFGSYTGNGSADGPFVYCGFRPRYVMVKCSSSDQGGNADWRIQDSSRDPYNVVANMLFADLSLAESTGNALMDLVSNGFKIRGTSTGQNASGATYIYICFAENPFQNALAR